MIRAILYEDKKDFRETFSRVLGRSSQIYLAASFANADSLLSDLNKYQPEVVLMDIQMPGKWSGLEALELIQKHRPETKVIIQTVFEDLHRIFVAICYGASGYFIKKESIEAIEKAIMEGYRGGRYFSPQIADKALRLLNDPRIKTHPQYISLHEGERKVLEGLCQGLDREQITRETGLAPSTVDTYLKEIYRKLKVNSGIQAIRKAYQLFLDK